LIWTCSGDELRLGFWVFINAKRSLAIGQNDSEVVSRVSVPGGAVGIEHGLTPPLHRFLQIGWSLSGGVRDETDQKQGELESAQPKHDGLRVVAWMPRLLPITALVKSLLEEAVLGCGRDLR
jgi:hypothetical protein